MIRPAAARWLRLVWLVFLALSHSACLPETQAALVTTASPSASPTSSPTLTSTILWFPPTITFTPVTTIQVLPTQEMHPALGAILFTDTFIDEGMWAIGRSPAGSVAYGQQALTLAVSQPRGILQTLRSGPELDNFYLAVDVLPSLCREGDAFGLLLRATSAENSYRLLLNCKGQVRLERLKAGSVLPLQDWQLSGQMPPGAMLTSRLAVWAVGPEIRIFINDIYQFTVRDPLWVRGRVGLFARAAGDTPLTVNFANLNVQAIDLARVPTPAPTATLTVLPSATRLPTATNPP